MAEAGAARLPAQPSRTDRGVRRGLRHRGAFGEDAFGRGAEAAARFFGTPQYIVGQTIVVALWIAANALAVSLRWDPYPFILLNLAFSTQAAYAAPLILPRRRVRPNATRRPPTEPRPTTRNSRDACSAARRRS